MAFNNDIPTDEEQQYEEQPSPGVVLKKARAKTSAGGTLSNNVTASQGAALPQAVDYFGRSNAAQAKAEQLSAAPVNYSQMQDFARQRSDQGDMAMLMAMAAQAAGEQFQPFQEHYLKKSLASREPIKMQGGLITPEGGFLKDPEAERDKLVKMYSDQAARYAQIAQTADTARERIAAQRAQQELMAQMRMMGLELNKQSLALRAENAAGNQNKAPAGYQWTSGPDGTPTLAFIPGGPADPKSKVNAMPSEDERKAAGYALRIQQGLDTISGITKETPSAAKQGPIQYGVGKVPLVGNMASNVITPEARQRVEAAQLDMLDAALTLNTGAAYTKEQLQGLTKSYFPQIGDGPETIKEKKRRLDDLIQTARIRAGRALPQSSGGAPAAAGGDDNDPLGLRRK